jgi:hypothetical protein
MYKGISKIFWTDAVKILKIINKHMVVLPSTGASCYHNCCIDGGTSLEYFGYILVFGEV